MSYVFSFLSVAITVRDKLESLCRELQRQNKMLMVCSFFFLLALLGFSISIIIFLRN